MYLIKRIWTFLPGLSRGVVVAVQGGRGYESPWDEKPYETLPTGKKVYVDESDVVTFLDPPKELIPLDPTSYNPAAYLWLVFLWFIEFQD